jgi:hypothetical protein
LSVPRCLCTIKYDLSDSVFPAKIVRCPLHEATAELFEIAEMLTCGSEQVVHHSQCRCLHCRAIRAVFKARNKVAPLARTAIAGVGVPAGASERKS